MGNGDEYGSCWGLPPGKVIAWLADANAITDPQLVAAWCSVLSSDEQRRQQAFHFADDRRLYLIAHALQRCVLSRCADVPPEDWQFISQGFGRPEVANKLSGSGRLRFNLSHTRGLAACVVARDVAVGIDVECLERRVDSQTIASRYFSQREMKALKTLSGNEQDTRFLEYWTLKESYVKARGGGLSIPLDSFYFERDIHGHWQIGFDSDDDQSDAWQFVCLRLATRHVMSIAIHRPGRSDYEIKIKKAVPLAVDST